MKSLPTLACCNFISNTADLREFALDNGFGGIDWTLTWEDLPKTRQEAVVLLRRIRLLDPLEVRYHLFLERMDLGDRDGLAARRAVTIYRRAVHLVAALGGRVITVHVGVGRDSLEGLSWDATVRGLTELTLFAGDLGVHLCLENLSWGWTSRPHLLEKLIRKTGCWATFDLGHARVSSVVETQWADAVDFVSPHPGRFLNAHIYHEENDSQGHVPPATPADMEDRLCLLEMLPACNWWVLELREEGALMQTLSVVRHYLARRSPCRGHVEGLLAAHSHGLPSGQRKEVLAAFR